MNRLEAICSIWACVNGTLAIVISIISLRQKKTAPSKSKRKRR